MLNDLPVGSGPLGEARLAARYLSKYLAKDLGKIGTGGLHRYEVGQGFGPKARRLTAPTLAEVLDRAAAIMGSQPIDLWDSEHQGDWDGPHSVRATWA